MSIVLKPSNNITLFSLKKTSFVSRALSVCKMVVRILSLRPPPPPPSWRIDRRFVNKHGGLEGSYGQSFEIVQNKKGKAST